MNKIRHLTMVANNYLNDGRNHTEVIDLLALGFTRKLLSWRDNYLIEVSRDQIKSVVKKYEDGNPIFDESIGMDVLDGVNTLIYTIIDHFIGISSNITARIHDQLSNLKCPTLSDFR